MTTCGCLTSNNVAHPIKNHDCKREIDKKSVLCPPCAVDWHGEPCDQYVRKELWWIDHLCARCGHDSAQHEFKEGHMPEETKPSEPTLWDVMTSQAFRDEGLLWAVNNTVLWPLGLAIGISVGEDGDENLRLLKLSEAETIVDGIEDLADEPRNLHPRTRFIEFVVARIKEMDKEEAKLAKDRLADLLNGLLAEEKSDG